MNSCDVVIVGGGVMGCSVAYHLLACEPSLQVAVVEKDPSYQRASSALSVGNIRTQFGLSENVRISQYALSVFATFDRDMEVGGQAPDVRFRADGNLMLIDSTGEPAARRALKLQQHLGCDVEWMSPEDLRREFSYLEVPTCVGGTFGPHDGHLDGYNLMMGYRAKAGDLGAHLVHARVQGLVRAGARLSGVRLSRGERIEADVVVNCAGAWCAEVAASAGVDLPVQPVERQAFIVESAWLPDAVIPLVGHHSGLYFRGEGGDRLLVGKSFADDRVGFGAKWSEQRFNERLWPELASLVPSFDRLRLVRGWSGLYAVNSHDGNAIVGAWPGLTGLYLANGFSGHGLQQAPAVGRYLAELILARRPSLDLSRLGPERLLAGESLDEGWLI